MIFHTPRALRFLFSAAAMLALTAAPLLAQSGSSTGSKKKEVVLVAPTPPTGKSDVPWTPYGVAVILGALIIGVNFIPSKRGHQD